MAESVKNVSYKTSEALNSDTQVKGVTYKLAEYGEVRICVSHISFSVEDAGQNYLFAYY